MANPNVSSNAESNSSSVLFNLRDLMRIEEERVAAEAAAEVALREAAKRKLVAEREAAARAQEAERQAALDEQTREQREKAQADLVRDTERERVLARVRLEVETAANAERRQRELEHAQALLRLEETSRKRLTTHATLWVAAVTVLVGVAGYTLANGAATHTVGTPSDAVVTGGDVATPVAAAVGDVTASPTANASDVEEDVAASTPREPTTAKPTSDAAQAAGRRKPVRRHGTTRAFTAGATTTKPLADVLDNDNDDPLLGMQ
jgi:hypothetical protein